MSPRVANRILSSALPALVAAALLGCSSSDGKTSAEAPDAGDSQSSALALSGGSGTVFDTSKDAFSLTARNLKDDRRDSFFVGNGFFNRNWVIAPSSTTGVDGLGPTYNASGCSACHFKDGRGAPPENPTDVFLGLLVRISIPGENEHGGPNPVPNYGDQFNQRSILRVPAEGTPHVTYEEVPGAYDDGTAYSLAKPTYTFDDLAFGPLPADVMISPRVAPTMVGLGLLEALDESTILSHADPDDADGDGISGKANSVWDVPLGTKRLGRFGWKANQPDIRQQCAGAFNGDIGITSSMFPDQNCPSAQAECAAAISGGDPEVDDMKLDAVTFYSHFLAVPARRDVDATASGAALFQQAGCASCHVPDAHTGTLADYPELSDQDIHPYSDMLLHDMGDDLADGRPDFEATGNEWRTPPLWGIGLVHVVNGHTRFLHDGRARNLTEAVLWHGGEAGSARDAFKAMSESDRNALVDFLGSL
jgi:CxxC motif-containing protein (DUF1111 family)